MREIFLIIPGNSSVCEDECPAYKYPKHLDVSWILMPDKNLSTGTVMKRISW